MAGLHAIGLRIRISLALVTAEGALAHENDADETRDEKRRACRRGAGVHAPLQDRHFGIDPYGAVLVLLACTRRAAGNALGVGAVHAQKRVQLLWTFGHALAAFGDHGVVDDVERQLVPRTAGNRAGMTADAATLIDDHNVTSHCLPFLLDSRLYSPRGS